jgi:hypothetical protein
MILPAAGRFVLDAESQVASAVDGYVSVYAEHGSSKTHNDKLLDVLASVRLSVYWGDASTGPTALWVTRSFVIIR